MNSNHEKTDMKHKPTRRNFISHLNRFIRAISICLVTLVMTCAGCLKQAETINIFTGIEDPKIQFAIDELRNALKGSGYDVQITDLHRADIVLLHVSAFDSLSGMRKPAADNDFLIKAEGFRIRKGDKSKIWVAGVDAAGIMYGGLELAEQVRLFGLKGISETDQNAYMQTRGVKFNIPLDVRTPTYTDPGDATQNNMPEMWNLEFWKEYIDQLALSRYNLISLWNLHPFPSMVKVPEYPDVALDDVLRSTSSFPKVFYEFGNGAKAPELLDSTEVIKKISIDEKILFWQQVMKYARDRNIDIIVMTWNIFDWGIDGKYGITEDLNNPVTRDYYRQSVKQMFLTYPDLAGIGLTVGENMVGYEPDEKEAWAFDTYALGVLDAAKLNPERKFTFVHRMHQGDGKMIIDKFAPLSEHENIDFLFSFKYAAAHALSSTIQVNHSAFVRDIAGMKTLWTLRNDDNFYFRWGAPDFVREFIKNIPYEVSKGFYYGSDGYVWGREFLSKEPESPRQLEIAKHWYHWMIWGRLGYYPELPEERFAQILQNRFPEADGEKLFEAWQEASMIYPVTTGFHWGAADFSWYIEGCKMYTLKTKVRFGFHDVNTFITQSTHKGTRNQSIPDYVISVVAKETSDLISPLDVSKQLHTHADKALKMVETINPGDNTELVQTLGDIRSMAFLGKYYAYKIKGATSLALFRETKEKEYQDESIDQLKSALEYWEMYIGNAMQQYHNPVWMKRVGHVDWVKITDEVKRDIEIARSENQQ